MIFSKNRTAQLVLYLAGLLGFISVARVFCYFSDRFPYLPIVPILLIIAGWVFLTKTRELFPPCKLPFNLFLVLFGVLSWLYEVLRSFSVYSTDAYPTLSHELFVRDIVFRFLAYSLCTLLVFSVLGPEPYLKGKIIDTEKSSRKTPCGFISNKVSES